MDFERTLIASFEHHYNLAEKHGCFAHFARALYRRVQKLSLTRKYKEEGAFTAVFDMLKSLAYIPTTNIHAAFDAVMLRYARNADGTDKFEVGSSEKRFIEYFVQTWLGHINDRHPMFPNELWNCFDLTREGNSKTTNSLEAWHNALKLTLGSPDGKRPRFWKWLRQMKKECSLKEAELIRLQSTPMKLKTADKRIAQQRKELAENYNPMEMFQYLQNQANYTVIDQF
uniref:MULE transposase domain-containing protein n=1 Tax=Ditylenchus dipsaci TaxID=166011 RepID=A0A915ETW7_9BILA